MPVEIRELFIKTTIEGSEPRKASPTTEGQATAPAPESSQPGQKNNDRIVKECINIIMDNLSSYSKER